MIGILPIILVLFGVALLLPIWRRVDSRHWTAWWDPASRPDGPISWNNVRALVLDDPLSHVPRLRWAHFLVRAPLYALNVAMLIVLFRFLLSMIDKPWLPDILKADPGGTDGFDKLLKSGQNFTAYVALLVAALTISFAYLQLRAKVRADNRQAWIDRARTHLGIVTSFGSLHTDETDDEKAYKLWEKFGPLRLELELMLNSSEKDHRLLEFLLHKLAVLRDGGEQIDDSERLKEIVERASCMSFDTWLPRSDERAQLITYILRLSHVVLKREWERVKQTR